MAIENPDRSKDRDERERIGELEAQVKELSGLVEILLAKRESDLTVPVREEEEAPKEEEASEEIVSHKHHFLEEMKESIGRALGGVEGESLESRIGGIWLSRIVAVLFMTLTGVYLWLATRPRLLWARYTLAASSGVFLLYYVVAR